MRKRTKCKGIRGMLRTGLFTVLAMGTLTGCSVSEQQVVTITHPLYEKISYKTVEVQRGDLSTSVTIKLIPEGYEEILYRAPKQSLIEELVLDEVHVSVGDKVREGDILVSFESDQIKETIANYEDEMNRKELLALHYEELMKVDGELDYEADIKMLREDIQVAKLYVEEARKRLAEYQIVARGNGIITDVSEYLQNRVLEPKVELITQVVGSGRYVAVVSDTELFTVGEVYFAGAEGTEYELRLVDKNEETMFFQPVAGEILLSDDETLTLTIERPLQENVVYVNRHALCTIQGEEDEEDTYCVYVMQESGYQRAVFVTPGERVGENVIITEGLNGGEKVVIR